MASGLPGRASAQDGRPPVLVEGTNVVLREKRVEDAAEDYAWRCDPELAAFDAVPALRMAWEDYLRIYKEELRYPPPRQRTLSIEDRQGKHIGNCMYYDVDEAKGEAELGIMIGLREYWNLGYGRDAVATLLGHIFETTQLNRIYLHTLTWNARAQKAFERAGFTPVREVLRNGHNFVLMEVSRDQFAMFRDPQGQGRGRSAPAGRDGAGGRR